MKAIMLLSVLLNAACGKVNLPVDTQLSTMNSITPQLMSVGSSEHSKIKEICDAVATKTLTINSLVNTDYIFGGATKQCGDTSFTNIPDSTVRLVNQSGGFKFAEGSNLFFFSDVETSDQGVLSTICANLNNLVSPIALSSTNLLYFTAVNLNSSDCLTTPTERCIKIERATKVNTETGFQGKVHTREWIRTRLDQPRVGFYNYRKVISEAGCIEGQYFGRTATLK